MKVVFYLNVVSPHQLPLAKELVRLVGEDNYRYVYVDQAHGERVKLGWSDGMLPAWCIPLSGNEAMVEDADILYSGIRDIDLFERRAKRGLKTFYCSERWFKPIHGITGKIRMLVPRYRRMARRFARWLNDDPNARYLSIGPWAAKDMERLGVKPYKIVPWGYFVEPSTRSDIRTFQHSNIRLLWVGRLLGWKRVDDIVRAVREHDRLRSVDDSLPKITLDIYGIGPEERKLKRMVVRYGLDGVVAFHPPVPIAEVRNLMHAHDVYVLSSNGYEGWGAVVSEALEEGMKVVGTYEAGASTTLLPRSNLYHAGDWKRLAEILRGEIAAGSIGDWTAKKAAERVLTL